MFGVRTGSSTNGILQPITRSGHQERLQQRNAEPGTGEQLALPTLGQQFATLTGPPECASLPLLALLIVTKLNPTASEIVIVRLALPTLGHQFATLTGPPESASLPLLALLIVTKLNPTTSEDVVACLAPPIFGHQFDTLTGPRASLPRVGTQGLFPLLFTTVVFLHDHHPVYVLRSFT